jgi:hypothetical protein
MSLAGQRNELNIVDGNLLRAPEVLMLDQGFGSVKGGGKLEGGENANKTFRFVQSGGRTGRGR